MVKKSGQNVANIKRNRVKRVQNIFFSPAARFFAKRVIYMSLLVNKFRAKRGGFSTYQVREGAARSAANFLRTEGRKMPREARRTSTD